MSPDSIVSKREPSLTYFRLKQGKICTPGEVQQVLDSNNRTNAGILGTVINLI